MQLTSQEVVNVYETMVVITDEMLKAATSNDWDRVTLLEQQCALHLRQLRASEPTVLSDSERERKIAAIHRMLAADRQIRDLTTPWMSKLSALVQNTTTERRLARAYGV